MSIDTRPPLHWTAVAPWLPDTSPALAREHVKQLVQSGGTCSGIADVAGLARTTVRDFISGRRSATPYTTTALLAVSSDALQPTRVDAGGTRLRLRALFAMGHSSACIARAVDVHPATIRAFVRGEATTISPDLRDAIAAVYDAWWDKRAPERTPTERAIATAARRRAITGDWCTGAALDDDLLDTPGYKPCAGWRPAIGTGPAPDIHPPARENSAKAV